MTFANIRRNPNGEGASPDGYLSSGTKAWGANRIRYPGSPRRKRCMLAVGILDLGGAANAINIPPGEYGRKIKTQRN